MVTADAILLRKAFIISLSQLGVVQMMTADYLMLASPVTAIVRHAVTASVIHVGVLRVSHES